MLIFVASANFTPASATTVLLPELTGTYELDPYAEPNFGAPGGRSIDFMLPDTITEIEQMTFVLSGQWTVGEIFCNTGFEDPEISPILPPIALIITSSAFPGDYFYAIIQMPDGPFENLTAEFSSYFPPGVLDFIQLIGNELQAELFVDMAIVGICYISLDTYGTLDEVALQLTGPVPTEGTAWGGVKSLYR